MLINKLKQLLSSQFIRNVGWLGGAQLVSRFFRLGTTVTLARIFSPEDYGLMAIIYTTSEFAMAFTLMDGLSYKIIQADEQDLKTVCDTSYWLNWILCGSMFIIQCLAAYPIAQFYHNNQLILPLCTAALLYLMFPCFMVQCAIIERANTLKITALCSVVQSMVSNILTIILAVLGMGIWSIVWSMILAAPVWIVICWMNTPWRPPKSFTLERWQEIFNFGRNLLGVELLNKLRLNLDYLIVGRFLGVNELGIYYLAFNAGAGITTKVSEAFMSALYLVICEVRGDPKKLKKQYYGNLKILTLTIVPLVLLQSFLAPFYVPIIFGQKWVLAIPILSLICLSVVPQTFAKAYSLLLSAIDKTHITFYIDLIFTVIFTASILLAVNWGALWVAATVLICHILALPIFIVWTNNYVFSHNSHLHSQKGGEIK